MKDPLRNPVVRYTIIGLVIVLVGYLLFCPVAARADATRAITNDTLVQMTPLQTVLKGESYIVQRGDEVRLTILGPLKGKVVMADVCAADLTIDTVNVYVLGNASLVYHCN